MEQIWSIVVPKILWYFHWYIDDDPMLIGRAFFPENPFLLDLIFSRRHGHLNLEDKIIMYFKYWLHVYTDYDSRPKVWITVLEILRELHIPHYVIEEIAAEVTAL